MRPGAELAAEMNPTEHVYRHSVNRYSVCACVCVCVYVHTRTESELTVGRHASDFVGLNV